MKLSPEDPRLSAYLLGELPMAEASLVEHAVAADPALRLSLDELRRVAAVLEGSLATAAPALRPVQREAVMRAVRHAEQAGKVVEFESARRGVRPWFTVIGAAAAVVLAVTLASRLSGPSKPGEGGAGGPLELALLPMPGPPGPAGDAAAPGGGGSSTTAVRGVQREELQKAPGDFLDKVSRQLGGNTLPDPARLPALKPLPPLAASGEIGLPVIIGHASYGWVRGWIRDRAALPPKDAVRLEELVNTFPLERQDGEGIAPRIDSAPSPWNPGSVLVAATLRGREGEEAGDTVVSWSFEAAEGVRVRMIASPGSDAGKLPDRLPAGRAATVLLEVVPAAGSDRLGVLKWEVDGEFTGRVVELPAGGISPGMRQLGLMAAFGMWLRGEGVDAAALEEILRQAGGDEDPGRADSRRLVRQALDVAAGGR
jgi:hypothetical protein